jgi:hypothetical protein
MPVAAVAPVVEMVGAVVEVAAVEAPGGTAVEVAVPEL